MTPSTPALVALINVTKINDEYVALRRRVLASKQSPRAVQDSPRYVDNEVDGICRDMPKNERIRWNKDSHRPDQRKQGLCSLGVDQVDMLYQGGEEITRHGQKVVVYSTFEIAATPLHDEIARS